jgi:hypothetical protein
MAAPTAPEPRGNGSPDAPAPQGEREAPRREFRSEAPVSHEPVPIAHFEPTPKPDPGASQNKPYVVWSSAPPPNDPGGHGPEE